MGSRIVYIRHAFVHNNRPNWAILKKHALFLASEIEYQIKVESIRVLERFPLSIATGHECKNDIQTEFCAAEFCKPPTRNLIYMSKPKKTHR